MSSSEPRGRPFGEGLAGFLRGNRTGGEVVAPRPAATVILLRDLPPCPPIPGITAPPAACFEVYLVRRAQQIAFMGGAHVFPGGRVEDGETPEQAAAREVREEIGVEIDPASLVRWARWITPEVEPKRFDAIFFVGKVPPGAAPAADAHEVTEGLWVTPREAIVRAERGELALPPPTLWNLLDLAEIGDRGGDSGAVLAAARGRALAPFEPRVVAQEDGSIALVLPGDACYEDPSARPPIAEQRRFVLEDGRWVARRGS